MLPDPTVPSSLLAVLKLLGGGFTAPTFATFSALVTGLIAQTGPSTVTGMLGFRCISVARDDEGVLGGGFHAMSDHLPGSWVDFARSGGLPAGRA